MMKALDFFCGAGGLTKGLINAGFQVIAGFDNDEKCLKTYEDNNIGAEFVGANIQDVSSHELRKIVNNVPFKTMLFAGCAPCQPFSPQKKDRKSDRNATLLLSFARIIECAKPKAVLVENVPGIARIPGNSTFNRFLKKLEILNYDFVYSILDAKEYGVPQTRKRLVLIAIKDGIASLPEPSYGLSLKPYKTVRDTISHFPCLHSGENDLEVPNHVAALLSPLNIKRLQHTPHDGGDRRSWPKNLRLTCHNGSYQGHTDVYGRMSWDSPAPTLTGRCNSISNGRYVHPEQDRAISLREAAALQTFPDDYVFYGGNTHIASQIGNAVPVRLAEELGKHILSLCKIG